MTKTFRVPEATIAAALRRSKRIMVLSVIVPTTFVGLVEAYKVNYLDKDYNLRFLLIALPILALLLFYFFRRSLKRWHAVVTEYEVRIKEGESISVNNPLPGSPKIDVVDDSDGANWRTLRKEDIKEIKYYEHNRISVIGKDGTTVFPLGVRLHPFNDLIDSVATLATIKVMSKAHFYGQKAILLYAPIIAFAICNLSSSNWVRLGFGLTAAIGFVYRILLIFKYSKNLPKNWLHIALFILLAFMSSVFTLLGLVGVLRS